MTQEEIMQTYQQQINNYTIEITNLLFDRDKIDSRIEFLKKLIIETTNEWKQKINELQENKEVHQEE